MSLQESLLKYVAHDDLKNKENALEGTYFLEKATFFLIKGKFKLYQMDIILQESKSSNDLGSLITSFDATRIGGHSVLDYGIGITLKQASSEILCEERKLEILLDLSKIRLTVFGYESKTRRSTYYSLSETLALCSLHSLYGTSFSNLTVTLCWSSPLQGTMDSEIDDFLLVSNPMTEKERSSQQSSELDISSDVMASYPSHWLLITITIGEILLMKDSVKDVLRGAHEMDKLMLSLSVGGEFQTVSLKIQVLGFMYILC